MILPPLAAVAALALAADGGTYVRNSINANDASQGCQYWIDSVIPWVQAAQGNQGPSATPGDTEFAAVSASFGIWQAQSNLCGNFQLPELPRTTDRTVGYEQMKGDANRNVIVFRAKLCSAAAPTGDACFADGNCGNKFDCFSYDPGNIAITTTTFSVKTGRIYDADVELNATKVLTAVDAPPCPRPNGPFLQSCVAFDIQNTMTHEVGHFMGLAHSPDSNSTMYFQAAPGELIKRTLDADTAQFVCDVYKKGRVTQPCTVRPLGSNDPLTPAGCNVAPGEMGVALAVGSLALALRARRKVTVRPERSEAESRDG